MLIKLSEAVIFQKEKPNKIATELFCKEYPDYYPAVKNPKYLQ